jgi:hypothetical protein
MHVASLALEHVGKTSYDADLILNTDGQQHVS